MVIVCLLIYENKKHKITWKLLRVSLVFIKNLARINVISILLFTEIVIKFLMKGFQFCIKRYVHVRQYILLYFQARNVNNISSLLK